MHCTSAVKFDIKIIENVVDLKELHKTTSAFAQKAYELSSTCTEEKTKNIFFDNFILMQQIARIIESKSDSRFSSGWEKYKVVVVYDSKHSKIQAFGVIEPDYQYQTTKCSKLFSLATVYWNIESQETKNEEYRVKGAGYATVKFCSELGKQSGSNGEVYLNSIDSAITYYRDKLGFKIVKDRDPSSKQTPMFLDVAGAKNLH